MLLNFLTNRVLINPPCFERIGKKISLRIFTLLMIYLQTCEVGVGFVCTVIDNKARTEMFD